MEIIKIEQDAIVLDAGEKKQLKSLLKYCQHRYTTHLICGIHKIGLTGNFINYMLKNLEGK